MAGMATGTAPHATSAGAPGATSSSASQAADRQNTSVARLVRRPGAVGIAITAWDIWRRLPPHQRQAVIAAARKQGPRIAAAALAARANMKNKKKR
jgi:hypothetical protein